MGKRIFKKNNLGSWRVYDDFSEYSSDPDTIEFYNKFGSSKVKTDDNYERGIDTNGNEYYIKYQGNPNEDYKSFDLYPVNDDLYEDFEYDENLHQYVSRTYPVPWGKYYTDDGVYHDPKDAWLPDLEIYPKTGKLFLNTYLPIISEYPFTGHSSLRIEPDYPVLNNIDYFQYVDKLSSEYDYKFVTNNCADATREVLEKLIGKKMNPFLFTTPGDSRDFLLENGGKDIGNGTVQFNLSEDQLVKLSEFISNNKDKYYDKYNDNINNNDEIPWYKKIF